MQSLDVGVKLNLDLVDNFGYLGDMLSVDGDADATLEDRIRLGWNKFRQEDLHSTPLHFPSGPLSHSAKAT